MRDKWDFYPTWEETTPKRVKHGIKAIHQKGQFCKEWWGKRWLEIIESYHLGERLNRGKRYARAGQVVEIKFFPGEIKASVQGSSSLPYRLHLSLKIWTEKEWELVFSTIKSDPLLLSQVLSGKIPPDLEQKLRAQKIDLFPTKYQDFTTDCSCPDWVNPCKHIAAVFFLIAESLDKNPFLLFEWRGREYSQLLENLLPNQTENEITASVETTEEALLNVVPLSMEHFWEGNQENQSPEYFTKPIEFNAAIIHQMGAFPLWQANDNFFAWFEAFYQTQTEKALEQLETLPC